MGMAWHVLKCIVYLSICIESNRTVGVGLWKFEIILCIAILRIVEPAGGSTSVATCPSCLLALNLKKRNMIF